MKKRKSIDSNEFINIGKFSVPIWCCKKKKTLPHYFNFIRNNESVGRLLAMFFIDPENKKKPRTHNWDIHESLKNTYFADVSVSVLGLRNLNFDTTLNEIDFKISITQDDQESLQQNKIEEDKKELQMINNEEKDNFLNYLQIYEFKDVKVYGDKNFQIFPMMKIDVIKKNFFGDEERYLLFELSEYSNILSERIKKRYKIMFECNLGVTRVDQEQYILKELNEVVEEPKEDKGFGEDDDDDDEQAGPTQDEIKEKLKD